jgi:hypothetical protein
MDAQVQKLAQQVKPFVPPGTETAVAGMIIKNQIHITVTKHRATKLGDYRPPANGKGHRITLNKSLNQYAFLITFVHEVAHLICWNAHGNRVAPHGKEWKHYFKQQMLPFLHHSVFPENVLQALNKYMSNPAASSCADTDLLRALHAFEESDGLVNLEDLPENQVFGIDSNKIFKKGPLQKKRFRCLNLINKRYYFVSALARVKPIEHFE